MASKSLNLIAVAGPTASGKTELGLELCRRLGGEIISADSRQMYRDLSAGTSKPAGKWIDGVYVAGEVPYHLVDVLDPKEKTDAAKYAELARPVIDQVQAKGRIPILVGGTGLYLRAVLEGLDPLPPRSQEIREELAEFAEANGRQWLHEELSRVDPVAAGRIAPNNLHRVVRALEVFKITGKPISSLWSGPKNGPAAVYLGIQWDRKQLEERIRGRSGFMFPRMIEEVRKLVPAVYSGKEPAFQSLGYPEALSCARGEISTEEGLALMIRATMQYAKRQATWFRNQTAMRWIAAGNESVSGWADQAMALIEGGDSSNASS